MFRRFPHNKSRAARMRVTHPSAWGNVSRRFVEERSTRPGVDDSMGDSGGALLCLSGWHCREQGGESHGTQGGLYTRGSVTGLKLEVELPEVNFEMFGELQLSTVGRWSRSDRSSS